MLHEFECQMGHRQQSCSDLDATLIRHTNFMPASVHSISPYVIHSCAVSRHLISHYQSCHVLTFPASLKFLVNNEIRRYENNLRRSSTVRQSRLHVGTYHCPAPSGKPVLAQAIRSGGAGRLRPNITPTFPRDSTVKQADSTCRVHPERARSRTPLRPNYRPHRL